MMEAISEVSGIRLTGFFSEEDLEQAIIENSDAHDMWDVYRDGQLAYYYKHQI